MNRLGKFALALVVLTCGTTTTAWINQHYATTVKTEASANDPTLFPVTRVAEAVDPATLSIAPVTATTTTSATTATTAAALRIATGITPNVLPSATVSLTKTPIRDLGIITATSIPLQPTTLSTQPRLPTATSFSQIDYVVQRGDTLTSVARRFELTVEAVAAQNNLRPTDQLLVGQVLRLVYFSTPSFAALALLPTSTTTDLPTATLQAGKTRRPTLRPSATATSTATSTATMTLLPPPTDINGLGFARFVQISDASKANIQNIYACGIQLKRNTRAFAKLGDCNSEAPHFLAPFDGTTYKLGDYGYLQPVIERFAGSYSRISVAVHRGMHTWSMFDPMWADKRFCNAGEMTIDCEFRLQNPSYVIIRLGTNDWQAPALFEKNLRRIVEYAIRQGIVPILGTKADQLEGSSNQLNMIIRQVAQEYNLPLWDFELVAATIPGRGLEGDRFHMSTYYVSDFTVATGFRRGHGVQNLSALVMLDQVSQAATAKRGTVYVECGQGVPPLQ